MTILLISTELTVKIISSNLDLDEIIINFIERAIQYIYLLKMCYNITFLVLLLDISFDTLKEIINTFYLRKLGKLTLNQVEFATEVRLSMKTA